MIQLLVFLIIIGGLLYVLNLLPLDETVKRIVWVAGIVVTVLVVLQFFLGAGGDVRLRH